MTVKGNDESIRMFYYFSKHRQAKNN